MYKINAYSYSLGTHLVHCSEFEAMPSVSRSPPGQLQNDEMIHKKPEKRSSSRQERKSE